jgi:hypothetical protein
MYIVRTCECTSQILKKLSQMVQNYSELYMMGWPGDSDLQLCHLPVDLRS